MFLTMLRVYFAVSGDNVIRGATYHHVPEQTSDGCQGRSVITQQTRLWCSIPWTRNGRRI